MPTVAVTSATLDVVVALGAPALVALFYVEGLLVGKVLQPTAVFVGYVVVASPSAPVLVGLVGLCIAAATVGQLTLLRGFDDTGEWVGLRRSAPRLDAHLDRARERGSERWTRGVERGFDRYGGAAICLSNALPAIRCLATIPAGASGYPRRRFLVASLVGNAVYFLLLVGAARGIAGLAVVVGTG